VSRTRTRFRSDGRSNRGTDMLEAGTPAPDFAVPDQDGTVVTLESLRGHWVAMWWYPMASTPG